MFRRSRSLLVYLVLLLAVLYLLGRYGVFDVTTFTATEDRGTYALAFCPIDDCEQAMLDAIGRTSDVRCAFYELSLPRMIALLDEKQADVLVYDENARDLAEHDWITPVPSDGLMHDKFCVLDRTTVITGSTNPTGRGTKESDNNLIIITSPVLAKNYLAEFDELKTDAADARVLTPRLQFTDIASNRTFLIENYFCPDDACERHVLETLGRAKRSIRFMTFSFTSEAIGDLLVEKHATGMNVSGVFEKRQESKYSEYAGLRATGIPVLLDGNSADMHHKVFLIDPGTDDAIVILGSYNPTANGNERNDENLLIIHDATIADAFVAEFDRIWADASTQ